MAYSVDAFNDEPRNPHGPSLIVPRLHLSDYTIAYDEKELKRLRVTHLVTAMDVSPPYHPELPQLKRLHVPIEDDPRLNIAAHFDQTTQFIREALADESSVVVVHCFMGVSRSATLVAAYLIGTSETRLTVKQAIQMLQKKRSVVNPNDGFVRQLKAFAARRDNIQSYRLESVLSLLTADQQ